MAKATATKNASSDATGAEVSLRGPEFDSAALAAIDSFDAALALVQDTLGAVDVASDELGDGFAILDDKAKLVGVPSLFISWNFNIGDYGEFVSAMVVARNESGAPLKVILNDGSTGIYKQLSDYTAKTSKMGGLFARQGLRRSDYTYTDKDGKTAPATTYYIDQTA